MYDSPAVVRTFSRSGATLIVDPMPSSLGASIGLWLPIGSAHEASGQHGLTHFVEHMVFKGAGDLDAEALSRVIDREGGYLNAFTERDCVCLYCTIPSDKASLAVKVLLDMAYKPRFSPSDFELEKDIIVNEILSAEDDLEDAGQDEFFSLACAGHPLGRRIAGTVDEVRSLKFEDLVAYHERFFRQGSVLLTVAGAVDPESIALQFERSLESLPPYLPVVEPSPARLLPGRWHVNAGGSQVYVFTGLNVEGPVDQDEYWLLGALSSAYGESMSSRLFMRLREKEGLCYSIGSSHSSSKLFSVWGMSCSTSPAQFPRLAEAYKRESTLFFEHGLNPEEYHEALGRLRGIVRLASDDLEYRMRRLARQFFFSGEVETVARTEARLCTAELRDIDKANHYIRSRLNPANEAMLFYGKISKAVAKTAVSRFNSVQAEASS